MIEQDVQRRPMPAFEEDPERRRRVIGLIVDTLFHMEPSLFDDLDQLVDPPAIDHDAYIHGYGRYGYDETKKLRAILTKSLAARREEIQAEYERVRAASSHHTA